MTATATTNTNLSLVRAIGEAMSNMIQRTNGKSSLSLSLSLGQEDAESLRGMLRKLESLEMTVGVLKETLIGTVVAKFKKHPVLGPTAKALVKNWKALVAKSDVQTKATVHKTKQKTKSKTESKQTHSFFKPRSSSTKSVQQPQTHTSTTPSKQQSVPVNPFFQARTRNPSVAEAVLAETKNLKRKLPPPEDLSPTTKKAVAAIFQGKSSKQILAEHRRVELLANREAERKKEAERASKRAVLFGEKSKLPSGSTHQRTKPGTRLLPMAPRFPVPNHVFANDPPEGTMESGNCNCAGLTNYHSFRSPASTTTSTTTTKATKLSPAKPVPWLSSPSALDTFDANTSTFTAIQRALFDTFSILPPDTNSDGNGNGDGEQSSLLRIDRMDKDGIVGSKTMEVFRLLAECIDRWRVARNESLERAAERHRKLARGSSKRRKPSKAAKKTKKRTRYHDGYNDDDDWLVGDDCDDQEGFGDDPLCLLVGPPSSGKTALVRAVAGHCGSCRVLEINTSRTRSGAALKHAIEEATQSNSSLEMLQNKITKSTSTSTSTASTSGKNSLFGKHTLEDSDSNQDSDPDSDCDCDEESSSKKKSPVTIVLIDEVDILFEEGDAGFWTALGALARATKCPIVLTANQIPPHLDPSKGGRLPCRIFSLEKPAPKDFAAKLWGICNASSCGGGVLTIKPELEAQGPLAIKKRLEHIAAICGRDLRKLLHELRVLEAVKASGVSLPWKRGSLPLQLPPEQTPQNCLREEKSYPENPLCAMVPTISSLEPSRICVDKHSLVTAQGTNLQNLQPHDTTIEIGNVTISRWHVVDDTTLILQCPPIDIDSTEYSRAFVNRWTGKILPLSLSISISFGKASTTSRTLRSPSRILVSETLADGTSLPGTVLPAIEYFIPEENSEQTDNRNNDTTPEKEESEATRSNQEESERADAAPDDKKDNDILASGSGDGDDHDGSIAWNAALADATEASETQGPSIRKQAWNTTPTTARGNKASAALAAEMDFLAQRARDISDASLLEDFGDGLPYLSGACRGFAYDLTGESPPSSGHSGAVETLKLHEKSKPPREEKLFALGWKDNCCFYGSPDTYMTPPSRSQRNQAKAIMNHFRGDERAAGQLACASANLVGSSSSTATVALSPSDLDQDSLLFREELDCFVHHKGSFVSGVPSSLGEDSYLPRGVTQAVLDLPEMLRSRSVVSKMNHEESHGPVWDTLEARRSKTMERILAHTTEYILPPLCSSWHKNDRTKWSYGRFGEHGPNEEDRNQLVLECLPFLRRIGILERSAEFLEAQQRAAASTEKEAATDGSAVSSLRRSTRRATRAAAPRAPRRRHYFDRLSVTLRRDEADLDTSAVGALFADQWQSDLVRPSNEMIAR